MIRIVIYEDNRDLRESLQILLRGAGPFTVLGAFENCVNVVEQVRQFAPELVLMDIDMPQVDGLQGLTLIKQYFPNIQVLMLTIFEDDQHVFEAICRGAVGYLLKETPPYKLIEALQDAYRGGSPMTSHIARKVLRLFTHRLLPPAPNEYSLSPREKDILTGLVQGNSYKMIAAHFGISIDTVRAHIKKVYEKLQVHSQTEAVSKAIREGLV
jgi:DNA-binding NarL/FixJ family response regulator